MTDRNPHLDSSDLKPIIEIVSQLDLDECTRLQDIISKRIALLRNEQRRNLVADIRRKASKIGVSLEEISQELGGRTNRKKLSWYANPENSAQIYRGSGPQPPWFKAALARGIPRETMRIPTPAEAEE